MFILVCPFTPLTESAAKQASQFLRYCYFPQTCTPAKLNSSKQSYDAHIRTTVWRGENKVCLVLTLSYKAFLFNPLCVLIM